MNTSLPGAPRPMKQVQIVLDIVVLVIAFACSYLLRFDFAVPRDQIDRALVQLPVVLSVQLIAIFLAGVTNFIWRYVGMTEVKAFARTIAIASVPLLLLRFGLTERFQDFRVPLSIIFMDAILAFCGLLGLRVLRRVLYEASKARSARSPHSPRRVLVVGAGDVGVMIAKEIGSGHTDLDLVGIVDDNPGSRGAMISGARVLGTTGDIAELCSEQDIEEVILAFSQASRHEIRRIVEICDEAEVKMRIIPSYHEVVGGSVRVDRLREVQIEDLLGREPVEVDIEGLRRMLAGRRVMVTGAGGSIGSEIARQVARFAPRHLLLVERSEAALFDIHRKLVADGTPQAEPVLADVGDEARMRAVFAQWRPEIVFHAAAHKHVPMVELNCSEAVRNNTLATRTLAQLAGEYDVRSFVLISTDKAIRPTSVMGATKRLAELVLQDVDAAYETQYIAVRFGNVMGSAGSVIPIFREQIENGGPVTVTHPEMERYFMTIPEASRLVLQASALGRGGQVLFLDMGEPIRIVDLAKDMITLSGLKPGTDIPIEFVGTRPGEKLYEELEHPDERLESTSHPKILLAHPKRPDGEATRTALTELNQLASLGMDAEIRQALARAVPEAHLDAERPAPGAPEARLERRPEAPARDRRAS